MGIKSAILWTSGAVMLLCVLLGIGQLSIALKEVVSPAAAVLLCGLVIIIIMPLAIKAITSMKVVDSVSDMLIELDEEDKKV